MGLELGDRKLPSLSSSSLSSSMSDDQKDPFDDALDNKCEQDGAQSPRSGSTSSPDVSTQTPQWSMVSVSPRGGSRHSISMSNSSRMKFPPVQAMGRGYDPNRIPSSIFSKKSATPMDWSVASNESLFSIHMENNSFSRPEDWSNSPLALNIAPESRSHDLNNFTPNLPPVAEAAAAAAKRTTNISVRDEEVDEEFHETPKMVSEETAEDHCKRKSAPDAEGVHLATSSNLSSDGRGVPRSSVSDPRASNESTQSSDSFAFPVFLSDGGKGGSLKAISENPEKTQSHPQDPKSNPEVATANWFSCFTCFPQRCY